VTVVTLLEKVYGSFSVGRFESAIDALREDLKVRISVRSTASEGWVQVDVTGEDEAVALNLLDREIGLAPASAEKVSKFCALRGRVISTADSRAELYVDVGVFEPAVYCAAVPLWRLQAQLSDGVKLPLQRLAELFGLVDFVPMHVRILDDLNHERGLWEAELSGVQVSRFSGWLDSNLDRLVVLGATRGEVEEAVERAGHFRDVVRIESFGLFEHFVLCKLGTEAVGLIPKLGPRLRDASLTPFSPKKIKQLIRRI